MVFPTKSNLMATKKTLELSRLGYDLMDRKRNIMMREMMSMINRVSEIQQEIDRAYAEAYAAIIRAKMTAGQNSVSRICESVPPADDLTVRSRSVMGVEIPEARLRPAESEEMPYGFHTTNPCLDETYFKFRRVKELTVEAAALQNSVCRLADAIKSARKRANALKNVVIPRSEETERYITAYLEEKEREEFTALKVIKAQKGT